MRPSKGLSLSVWLLGVASGQTGQQGLTRPTPAVLVDACNQPGTA